MTARVSSRLRPVLTIAALALSAPAARAQVGDDMGTAAAVEQLARLAAVPMAKRAPRWRCTPTTRSICDAGGCSQSAPSVWVQLNFAAKSYERCDVKSCDPYAVSVALSGIYTNVIPRVGGMFVKAVNDGSEYTEVISAGTTVYVMHGACVPAP